MAKILVFAEFTNEQVKRSSLELIQAAQGNETKVVLLGPGAKQAAQHAAQFGTITCLVNEDSQLENYNPQLYSELLSSVMGQCAPDILLASSTATGRDLFPRLAAKMNCGVISDCTEFEINGDDVKVRRPMYAGKCSAAVKFKNSGCKIVLMRPNQLPLGSATSSATTNVEEIPMPSVDLSTIVKEVVRGNSEKLDLTEANIVVSGGRGLKEAKNFSMLEELADVLGATVGASRAVVDAGWVPHSMQVGQTGKTVAPSLYIACGISGAIQHLAGMSSSKVIVAINKDPNAPIFQKATYGIVGDVFEVVPRLSAEFKKVLQQ